MADQKRKKSKNSAEIFCIFDCLLPPKPISQDYHKIQKQEPLGDYFCLKMISKLALQYIFQEKHADVGGLETN